MDPGAISHGSEHRESRTERLERQMRQAEREARQHLAQAAEDQKFADKCRDELLGLILGRIKP